MSAALQDTLRIAYRTRFAIAIAAVMLCVIAPRAAGQWDAARAARLIPADADIFVASRDLAGLRDHPVFDVASQLAHNAGAFAETRRSFEALLDQLGLEGDGLEALAGKTVVYAARGEGPEFEWAVLAEVDRAVADAAKLRLARGPRALADGTPLFAVKGGGLLIATVRRGDRSFLALGPERRSRMLSDLAGIEPPTTPLADLPAFAHLGALAVDADAAVFIRPAPEADDPPRTREGSPWIGIQVDARPSRRTPRGVIPASATMGVALHLPELGAMPDGRRHWSARTLERLEDNAFLVALDWNPLAHPHADAALGEIASALLEPLAASAPEFMALAGQRVALVVGRSDEGPLDVTAAFDTDDAAALSAAGDALMLRLLESICPERAADGAARRAPTGCRWPDHAGMPARATRTVDLGEQVPGLRALGWSVGPRLAWRTTIGEPCGPDQHRGWWVGGLGAASTHRLAQALAEADADRAAPGSLPWISLGVVKPAALLARLEDAGVPAIDGARPLARVDTVRWSFTESSDEAVAFGIASMTFNDSADAQAGVAATAPSQQNRQD